MRILESLRVALTALGANRLRSILTMLGIVIGVAAVLALVSFGQGFQNFVNNAFQSLGSNLVVIFPSAPGGPNARLIKAKPLTLDDAQAIANPFNVSGVAAVAPVYNVNARVVNDGNSLMLQVNGVTVPWQQVRDWPVSEGRFIENSDLTTSAHVAVLGAATAQKLFDQGLDPVGQSVRINNIPFEVIGILVEKGGGAGSGNVDQVVLVPLTTAQKQLADSTARTASGSYTASMIFARAASTADMQPVSNQVRQLLSQRHKVQYAGEEDFQVISAEQILLALNSITGLLTVFLGLIAGISLLVGGIGVMNIMLVSVTERTREIGLRKAVGARYSDLMLQFLIESIALSVGGGLLGIGLGASMAFLAGQLVPQLSITLTLPSILLATGVSTAIGLFFGLYPASRAASLNPIEALRYE